MAKRAYLFYFRTEEEACAFFEKALMNENCTLVQHPMYESILDLSAVLVTGTGSSPEDFMMLRQLDAHAHSLGGFRMPDRH